MKIKREINGTEYEFELTSLELRDAYNEKHIGYIRQDVKEELDEYKREYIESDLDSIVDAAAKIINSDDYLLEAYWDCIRYAIKIMMN